MGRRGPRQTENPRNPAALVRALRACRDVLRHEVDMHVTPFGMTHRLSSAIRVTIDALADRLTGQRDYFHESGGGATTDQRNEWEARMARERGAAPWNADLDPPRQRRRATK